MAEKKSFVFYNSYEKPLAMLSDEERGKLLMALIRYSQGEEVPSISPAADMAFEFIRQNMDRDAASYEDTVRKRSAAGKQGGRPAKSQTASEKVGDQAEKANGFLDESQKAKKANGFSGKQTKAKKADNDNVNVNVNENDNNPPIVPPEGDEAEPAPKEPKVTGFDEFWQSYPHKVGKKAALSAWKKLKPNAGLRAKIMESLETQKSSQQWRRENGRYIPNPATWLNQGRWDDQLDQVSTWNTSKGGTSYEPDFSKWELPD